MSRLLLLVMLYWVRIRRKSRLRREARYPKRRRIVCDDNYPSSPLEGRTVRIKQKQDRDLVSHPPASLQPSLPAASRAEPQRSHDPTLLLIGHTEEPGRAAMKSKEREEDDGSPAADKPLSTLSAYRDLVARGFDAVDERAKRRRLQKYSRLRPEIRAGGDNVNVGEDHSPATIFLATDSSASEDNDNHVSSIDAAIVDLLESVASAIKNSQDGPHHHRDRSAHRKRRRPIDDFDELDFRTGQAVLRLRDYLNQAPDDSARGQLLEQIEEEFRLRQDKLNEIISYVRQLHNRGLSISCSVKKYNLEATSFAADSIVSDVEDSQGDEGPRYSSFPHRKRSRSDDVDDDHDVRVEEAVIQVLNHLKRKRELDNLRLQRIEEELQRQQDMMTQTLAYVCQLANGGTHILSSTASVGLSGYTLPPDN